MDLREENIEWLMESSATVEQLVAEDAALEMRATEARELSQFLQVLRAAFRAEPVLMGPAAFGVLESDEDFMALLRRLKALGETRKLLLKGREPIKVEHPYVIDKYVHFYCSAGGQTSKQEGRSDGTHCKAAITMRQVDIFSRVSIPASHRRIQVLRKLRQALVDGTAQTDRELWVWVSLPRMHHHDLHAPGRGVDAEVKAMMHGLVREEPMTVKQVQQKVREVVNKEFARDVVKPAPDNTAFYPTEKMIYYQLRHDGLVRTRRRDGDVTRARTKAVERLASLRDAMDRCNDVTVLKMAASLLKQMEQLMPKNVQECMDQPQQVGEEI